MAGAPAGPSVAAERLLKVGPDVGVGEDVDVDVEVDVEVDVDVGVDVDVEHDVGAVCAQATPDSPRENSSTAATSMVAKTIHVREMPAIITSRTAFRWGRRPLQG